MSLTNNKKGAPQPLTAEEIASKEKVKEKLVLKLASEELSEPVIENILQMLEENQQFNEEHQSGLNMNLKYRENEPHY